MILCVDVGNSFVKLGVVTSSGVLGRERVRTAPPDIPHLELALRRAAGAVLRLDGVVVSSVVPAVTARVADRVREVTGQDAHVVSIESPFPFSVDVERPERVGVDRLCSAAGAIEGKRRNAIVADAGSAITVDVVRNGRYLGGMILPGPVLSLRGLATAGQLPVLDPDEVDDSTIGTTEGAMRLGVRMAASGGVVAATRWIEQRHGRSGKRYLTGGASPWIMAELGAGWKYAPDLTLIGMASLATRL